MLKVSEHVGKNYQYGLNNGQSFSVQNVQFHIDVWRFRDMTSTRLIRGATQSIPFKDACSVSQRMCCSWGLMAGTRVGPKYGIAAEEARTIELESMMQRHDKELPNISLMDQQEGMEALGKSAHCQ